MATNRIPAPKGDLKKWRDYLKWLENKNSKPGEFRGDLKEFKGSAKRGSGNNETLNACIAAIPVFKDFKPGEAKEAWKINHPWSMDEKIAEKFFTEEKKIQVLLTPHHLISCCVTEALTRHFADVIENDIGYNVNSPHNLLILPNSTALACYLGVPPHEGGHEYDLSLKLERSTLANLKSKVGDERVWENRVLKGYHAKVFKLVNKVIIKHFNCKENLDHNKFIADMNSVSKRILKFLDKFHWVLHENGDDYHPDSEHGCRNTRFISSYIHGPGEEKARARESAKRSIPPLQTEPCASKRVHKNDLQYFLHKDEGREKLRKMGMKVATEVEWIMSASSSKTPAKKDKKQTETA